jgi:hypothetical protein
MKQIVTQKLIVNLSEDGSYQGGVLQYRLRTDGSLDPKSKTMTIDGGININDMNAILDAAKNHVAQGEGLI